MNGLGYPFQFQIRCVYITHCLDFMKAGIFAVSIYKNKMLDSGMMFSGLQRSVLIYSRKLFRFQRCVLTALSVFAVHWL